MKRTLTALIYTLLPALTVFGPGQAAASVPDSDTLLIVVLGSSTAAGSGASPRDSAWAYRYADYLETNHAPARLINIARGGYTSYHLQPDWYQPPESRYAPDSLRNISRAFSFNPNAIIVNLPSNDAARNYTLEEQKSNFERISDLCDSAHIPLWFSTTQPRNMSDVQRLNLMEMRAWITERYKEHVLDFWGGIATTEGRILPWFDSGDGVHLNNAGHALLYERTVQMNLPGKLRPTAIATRRAPLPEVFAATIYPNPFTSHTTAFLELVSPGETTIQISGVLGNILRTVHSGYLYRGRHTIRFDISDLPTGLYFYFVRSGKEVQYGKILKIPG